MATSTIASCLRRVFTCTVSPLYTRFLSQNAILYHSGSKYHNNYVRFVSSEPADLYRKVTIETDGDVTTVEANYEKHPESFHKVDNPHRACPICSRNIKVTHKDVLILNQFITKEGHMLPRRLTGVCREQQRHLEECLRKAHLSGLLPDHQPPKIYGVFKEQGWKPKRKIRYHRH